MRALLLVVIAVLVAAVPAAPAQAHSGGSVEATNYRTTIRSIEPRIDGLEARIVDLGDQMELRNTGTTNIEVLGYDGEPYLRVEPDGVWRNKNSPASYLNESQDASNVAPEFAGSDQPAEWEQLSSEPVVTWHDHRIHWMADLDPPIVRTVPGAPHLVIPGWQVQLVSDGQPVVVTGDVEWSPGPSPTVWYGVIGTLLLIGGVCAVRNRWPRSLLVLLTTAMVVGDAIHVFGVVPEGAGTVQTRVSDAIEVLLPSVLAWIVAILGIRMVRKGDQNAFWFLTFSAALLVFLNGAGNLADLGASQVQYAGEAWVARAALSVVLGAGGAVLLISSRRLLGDRRSAESENRSILGA